VKARGADRECALSKIAKMVMVRSWSVATPGVWQGGCPARAVGCCGWGPRDGDGYICLFDLGGKISPFMADFREPLTFNTKKDFEHCTWNTEQKTSRHLFSPTVCCMPRAYSFSHCTLMPERSHSRPSVACHLSRRSSSILVSRLVVPIPLAHTPPTSKNLSCRSLHDRWLDSMWCWMLSVMHSSNGTG
jgi:hypothetical protein